MKFSHFNINSILIALFLFISIGSCFGALGNVGINLDLFRLSIYSPGQIIYHYNPEDVPIINLSAYSNRNATFYYNLRDVVNDNLVHNHVVFTPNTTFVAVFGLNELTVFANDSSGNVINKSVTFLVLSYNSSPVITLNNSNIYACEDNFLSYFFKVTDADGNNIISTINPTYPNSPFYLTLRYYFNSTTSFHEVFSGILSKSNAGMSNGSKGYLEDILVSDGEYNDTVSLNVTVIGVNHAPVMENLSNQSFIEGETFYKQLIVNDIEDGNSLTGNLSFNISFKNRILFNISSNGLINFVTNSSSIGSHNVTVCAIDKGIHAHSNISLCGQTGGNLSNCKNFALYVSGCGDGVCNNGETCSSCSSDCGECGAASSGGGGGGIGGVMHNLSLGDIIIKHDLVILNIKKGEIARQSLNIKNSKQQFVIMRFSLSYNLKDISMISARNLTIKPYEQKLFDIDFFCNETTLIGVYAGKILIVYENFTKEIPLLVNVNEKDSLFDIILYADKKKITAGKDLLFHLRLYNLGRPGIINASVEYYIKDFDGKIISRKEKNISVDTNSILNDKFIVPKNLEIGRYALGVNFKYGNFSGASSDSFEVVSNWIYFYTVLLFLIVISLIIIIYVKIRNYYRKKALNSLKNKLLPKKK